MDPLQDNGLSIFQPDQLAIFPQPGLEVVSWQLHFLTPGEALQVISEQGKIQGINRLEIRLPIFSKRRFVAVEKIVIKLEWERRYAQREQLHGESPGGCCLAGRGRPGD